MWSRQCLNGSAVTQYVTMALAYHYSAFFPKASLQFLLKSSGFLPSFGGEFCYVVQVLLRTYDLLNTGITAICSQPIDFYTETT